VRWTVGSIPLRCRRVVNPPPSLGYGGVHDVIENRLGSPALTVSARMCEDSMRPSAPGLTVCILTRQLLRGLFFFAPTDELHWMNKPPQTNRSASPMALPHRPLSQTFIRKNRPPHVVWRMGRWLPKLCFPGRVWWLSYPTLPATTHPT